MGENMFLNQFNRYCGWILAKLTTFSLLSATAFTSFYLSVMQVERFLQGGVAVAGILFALCSIMYGRAALDFDNAQVKKLAIQAAEDSFVGAMLSLVYFTTSSIVFFMLHESGNNPPVVGKLELDSWLPLPGAWAMTLHILLATPALVKIKSAVDRTAESWAIPS